MYLAKSNSLELMPLEALPGYWEQVRPTSEEISAEIPK